MKGLGEIAMQVFSLNLSFIRFSILPSDSGSSSEVASSNIIMSESFSIALAIESFFLSPPDRVFLVFSVLILF